MLPDQVASFWHIIKYAIEQSLPPTVHDHPDKMNRILSAALTSRVDVWASYTRVDEKIKFEGIVLTKILYDDVSDVSNLLIYCIYGYGFVNDSSWPAALKTLVKYAKGKNCSQVIAYTELPYVVGIAKQLGADIRFTFISFDVDKIIEKINELGG